MKKIKDLFILGILFISFGIGCFSIGHTNFKPVSASTNQTINEITGCKRISGINNKTFIRFACNDVVGSYQTLYSGYVYDSNGNPLPLDLYQNGSASGDDYANGGTRRFELKTDSETFISAIGNSTSFYITSDSVFTNGDVSISFAKQYEFISIYDGNFKFQEVTKTDVSFSIKEVETRLSSTRFRIGVGNMQGLAPGFNDIFKGNVQDVDGNNIEATIIDAAVGNTSAGNRRVYIDLSRQVKDNIFYIKKDSCFLNNNGMKCLSFSQTYRIANTSLDYCDNASHHIMGSSIDDGESISQTCEVCGHSDSVNIYQIKLGNTNKYCQAINNGDTQKEISIKIGGCSGYDSQSIPNVFRGIAKLNNEDVNLKISISEDIVRIYMYLDNENLGCKSGVISILNTLRFKSNDGKIMRFVDSVNIRYNTSTFKYRIDPIFYSYKESNIYDVTTKNWVSENNGEIVISFNDVSLTNGYSSLESSLIYRGSGIVDGNAINLLITLQLVGNGNKLAFIFNGNSNGLLLISKETLFELDTPGTSFVDETNAPDIVNFIDDIELSYDADNNLINAEETTLSLSGLGNWSQSLDNPSYNSMCSFDDCSIIGISEDKSDVHPETLKHRGYHFYGKGYNKNNENEIVDVDIWISDLKNTDNALNISVVKVAIYFNLQTNSNKNGVKLHKDDLFICSAYNLTLRLDDDYLVKWHVNSSRTTAGKYNNDKVGPIINVDINNLPTYVEGDEKPTLPVSVNDDVDDVVPYRAQIWQEGSLDSSNRLVKGNWKVTLTARDSSGNEAIPIEITICVLAKNENEPIPSKENPVEKGCSGNITSTCVVSLLTSILLLTFIYKKKTLKD